MKLIHALLLAAAFVLPVAHAAEPVEGKHYTRLQLPQPTEVPGKVEVIEFFWYGCPHCADFEPLLKQWLKQLPPDVHFRKVPAVFNPTWGEGARLYYTLEALGLLDKLNDAVFEAMTKQRIRLDNEKVLAEWIAKQGVDAKKFMEMYKSFAIDGKVRRAAEMTQEYGFGGVPVLIVGGKYMPAPGLSSFGEMLKVVEGLIAKNRAELKKK
ncbi:MAG: thiol:disulfide interchange protein DsbA/DsbL [Rhodocyclaceae bacterium]|nr:thiol:disulfide interchange protein DsbA/DsbL [Rhodocyclaceae bacterium]